MPGGSVTKIWRTYKKWTYIARETHEKAGRTTHEENSISHKISQYSTSATNRIQERTTAYTETTKHEDKEKATAENWTRTVKPVTQRYRMSYPDPEAFINSGIKNQTPRDSNPRSSGL
jgi:hypothetical protein